MNTTNQTTQHITPTEDEKREWSRMARAAYNADRNDIGHRFSGAAALRIGERIPIDRFDALQSEYRSWLIDGFKSKPASELSDSERNAIESRGWDAGVEQGEAFNELFGNN